MLNKLIGLLMVFVAILLPFITTPKKGMEMFRYVPTVGLFVTGIYKFTR